MTNLHEDMIVEINAILNDRNTDTFTVNLILEYAQKKKAEDDRRNNLTSKWTGY